MITTITPANSHYRYSNQDCDERQAILSDLQRDAGSYLRHPDGQVRSLADWTLAYWGISNTRWPNVKPNERWAREYLGKLHRRLRELAVVAVVAVVTDHDN